MAFFDVSKILLIPALIAAALYGLVTFIIVPFIRHHRNRYSQYLPLESIQHHTSGFRDRLGNWVMRLVVPRRQAVFDAGGERSRSGSEAGEDFTFEEGRSMVGFDAERVDRQVRGGDVESGR